MNAYHPATDDAWPDVVMGVLEDHRHEWCHAGRMALELVCPGSDLDAVQLAEYTYRAVVMWRRLGRVIEGDNVRGYRYVGSHRPRFVNLAHASQWPDVPLEGRRHRRWVPPREQLTISEAVVG